MPLEQLLAMYGYSLPTEEGEEEEEEEGAESREEEREESGEEGNSPPVTSQASSNPSSSPQPSTDHEEASSHKQSSKSYTDTKSIDTDSPSPPPVPHSPQQPEVMHDVIDDHNLAEEIEIIEHPAELLGSPSSSVLGKHPRSEEPGDEAVYRDVMLSSRTELEGITC